MTVTPNSTLRAVRMSLLMSQDDFARALRKAGCLEANKRLVQRWESGAIVAPRPNYARALERVTGLPLASLGFSIPMPDGRGGHDSVVEDDLGASEKTPQGLPASAPASRANFSGIWLSRYEYFSSSRDQTLIGLHHVVVLQHGDRLTVRSLPQGSLNPDSPLTMDLTVDGNVVTGTWVEQTASDGYYRGARYHGAVQLLVEPTGRRMRGKWCGFGSAMDVNTGPWELTFKDASTAKAAMDMYNVVPTSEDEG